MYDDAGLDAAGLDAVDLDGFCCFISLKKQCHEIFEIFFSHESNPFGSLINSLKWFC